LVEDIPSNRICPKERRFITAGQNKTAVANRRSLAAQVAFDAEALAAASACCFWFGA